MSAAAAELTTTRYEGLIRTAQELYDAHEESGWRLANVIYDAVEELRAKGYTLQHSDERFAGTKVAGDMARYRMGARTVYFWYLVWKRYGDRARRIDSLTFGDHRALVVGGQSGEKIAAMKQRRAAINSGEKPEFSSTDATLTAVQGGATAGRTRENVRDLQMSKARLRRVLKTNVWDYPDHQKVLDHLAEIQDLLDQIKAKPWNPDGAS